MRMMKEVSFLVLNDQVADSLEQLLESLIKMVGKANQNADSLQKQLHVANQDVESLQKRICQLEWIMKRQLHHREMGPLKVYPTSPTNMISEISENFPFHI
ncbi:hypothetical protein [Bacillus sp. MRMR6]|uniref:hypothetical protein n=1 Tax=Bacillus sp. MRMR6 TaxID=1928617 RepID=UPI000952619A|nr:hypothetical protein [Bacillus sp. MRMR6]OLS41134.1 hypothetical protein BTR25_04535 [Bacillus sp. MRMR6]